MKSYIKVIAISLLISVVVGFATMSKRYFVAYHKSSKEVTKQEYYQENNKLKHSYTNINYPYVLLSLFAALGIGLFLVSTEVDYKGYYKKLKSKLVPKERIKTVSSTKIELPKSVNPLVEESLIQRYPRGVGGWLLIYVIGTMGLSPLFFWVYILDPSLRVFESGVVKDPNSYTIFLFGFILSCIYVVMGIISGIYVMIEHRKARIVANAYFVSLILLSILHLAWLSYYTAMPTFGLKDNATVNNNPILVATEVDRYFIYNGNNYTVPESRLEGFLSHKPDAQEVGLFDIGEDKPASIPLSSLSIFVSENPDVRRIDIDEGRRCFNLDGHIGCVPAENVDWFLKKNPSAIELIRFILPNKTEEYITFKGVKGFLVKNPKAKALDNKSIEAFNNWVNANTESNKQVIKEGRDKLIASAAGSLGKMFVYVGIWGLYFAASKRVKNTFPSLKPVL